ncbi:MAG: potassium channel protein [Dehalococcoidia bacterium]|nr:potassium channel protein [Dehalococcoidia bacterium]MDH4299869.1 potassium channel protein [Dehalococcoidia bacterium]MDH4367735.1 potassium channel protein [Dehalococcoidia bacterium]
MPSGIYRRFVWAGFILIAIILIGTVGYWFIGGGQYSFVDTLYMTVITITTIGFAEIIDLSGSVGGRIFTIFIAVSGVGTMAYIVTNLTALIVEGQLTESFRRRRMEKIAGSYKDHYIVCGLGRVGCYIANELRATRRPHVVVDVNKSSVGSCLESLPDEVFIEGDATDSDTLLKAGVEKAAGLFAVAGDDNQNLVVSLTAKQLNPKLRVVARVNDMRNSQKMKKAGADAVVSPCAIGGLRMASEMVRPTVVSFLDTMLRDTGMNLRVEELPVPESLVGRPISALNLKRCSHALLLAVKTGDNWVYNPSESYVIAQKNTLVFMTTPEGRDELAGFLRE